MRDDILYFAVTGLGILLCVSLIVFIMLGKRIETDSQKPQELQFKGLRARTNVVIMFLILSLIPAILPLYLRSQAAHQQNVPGVEMYEKWTIRGQIVVDEPETSSVLIQPAYTDTRINADGTFKSDIPVSRDAEGKLRFPTFIIEHSNYRTENIDLGDLKQGTSTFGTRNQKAEFNEADRAIKLHKPIELLKKPSKP